MAQHASLLPRSVKVHLKPRRRTVEEGPRLELKALWELKANGTETSKRIDGAGVGTGR